MRAVAAMVVALVLAGLATGTHAAVWHDERYEIPPYTGNGDIPGNHITDNGWVGTSAKRLEGFNSSGGAPGNGCIWAMSGGQAATLLADPGNTHASAEERVSVWVWTRDWNTANFVYYSAGHVRSTPDGTDDDMTEASMRVAYGGDGKVVYLQRDPLEWVDLGALPIVAWVQFVWDFDCPAGQAEFNVYDDQGARLMGTAAPVDVLGTAPTSSVNGMRVAVQPTVDVDGWTGWDNLVFETLATDPVRTWMTDAIGDWNDGTNWDILAAPDANTHTAVFGDVITSARTIATDRDVTVKTVQFDNANSYIIAGAGSVNMEADTGNASLDVNQGDHEFQVRVNLNSSTDADVAAGASLAFANVLTLSGNTLTKTGDGTLSITNTVNTGGGSVVGLAGTITGGGTIGGSLTNTSATVAPGTSPGTLTVEGDFSQAVGGTLAIELAGTASGEFDVLAVLGSASLGGALDVAELYTPDGADTWTILTAGGGITGSFDIITAGYQVALADGDTELVLSLAGALLPGDANGDGCVDDLDLTALAVHWQQATNLWEDGDFDGNGIVDDLDLTALAVNWQQGCGGGGSLADALAAANVPEPVAMTLTLLALPLAIRRRF